VTAFVQGDRQRELQRQAAEAEQFWQQRDFTCF
jgi:hypothetical protein